MLVEPTTPVCGAPGVKVAEPPGRLFDGCGALELAFGAGGDWLAPDWASAGAASITVKAESMTRRMVISFFCLTQF